MDMQALVDRVGPQQFGEACRWAWATAAGIGSRSSIDEEWSEEIVMVPHEL